MHARAQDSPDNILDDFPGEREIIAQHNGLGIHGANENDIGLVRQFPIYERLRLNLFVFGTNVFNHINPANPNTSITTITTVGKILGIRGDGNTSGIGPRQLTLGLRAEF
ncbi:MAG TPA: hypothetical protein VFL57_03155 [Bryobacteraceae bacterium]|nr:hypothetical protein [Bryobacteraceae bacterium]